MVLNGINYTEKHLTDEEMAVVEAMREADVNPYDHIEKLNERIEVLEGIVRDIAYAHDNIKALQADIGSYIRKM